MEFEYSEALILLSDLLARRNENPVWFIVCGGSALQAHGTIQRATKDIDIFAERRELEGISAAYPLSQSVQHAIIQVADLLKLPSNWLNAATSLFQLPLNDYPDYFWINLKDIEYGSHVKISYLSTKGLITLKTLAALQRDAPRDIEDLIALTPLASDIQRSIDWCLSTTVENSALTSQKIKTLLTHLDHAALIERYQA